jgi:hypothetical protein
MNEKERERKISAERCVIYALDICNRTRANDVESYLYLSSALDKQSGEFIKHMSTGSGLTRLASAMNLAIDTNSAHGVELDLVNLGVDGFVDNMDSIAKLARQFKFQSFCGLFSLRITVEQASALSKCGELGEQIDELIICRDHENSKYSVDNTVGVMDSIHSAFKHIGLFVDINLEHKIGTKTVGFNRYANDQVAEVGPGYAFKLKTEDVHLDNLATVISWAIDLHEHYGISISGYQHDVGSIALSHALSPFSTKDNSEITDEGVDVEIHPVSKAINVVRTVVVDDCSFCQYNEKLMMLGCEDDQNAVAMHISSGICLQKAIEANRTPPRSVKKVTKHKGKRMPLNL